MNMRCNDTRALIGAYIDGELDLVRSLDIEGHLNECSVCSQEYGNLNSLHRAIREGDLYFDAPAGLAKQIRAKLGHKDQRHTQALILSRPWAIARAAIVALVILILVGVMIFRGPSSESLLARDLVSSHVRSLQGRPTDVDNDDRHTVKPWFNGKVDFSPPVPDLTEAGFKLKGGRLDYVGGRPVAVIVYGQRQHVINLYIWPSNRGANTTEEVTSRQGYNIIHWTKDGMTFWAVSDLNAGELHDFVKAQQE
jgi:anti-sigma factor RsiW